MLDSGLLTVPLWCVGLLTGAGVALYLGEEIRRRFHRFRSMRRLEQTEWMRLMQRLSD